MATRYYLTTKAPGVALNNESYQGSWQQDLGGTRLHRTRGWITWECATSKTAGGRITTLTLGETNDTPNYDCVFARWATPRLASQTLSSGTATVCAVTQASSDASTVYWNIYAYSTVGDTSTVRDVLINHEVSATDWTWAPFGRAIAVSVPSVSVSDGDRIMVEVGCRFGSNGPGDLYDTTASIRIGTTDSAYVPLSDAVDASGPVTDAAGWIEFPGTVTEASAVDPPAHDACADAIVISALPYADATWTDTTQSADTDRAVWYQYTSSTDQYVFFSTFETNYQTQITAYSGSSCGGLTIRAQALQQQWLQEAQSVNYVYCTSGTTYFFRVKCSDFDYLTAPSSGGAMKFHLFAWDPGLEIDDLVIDCQHLVRWREGTGFVDLGTGTFNLTPTGSAIDYSRTSMEDYYGDPHAALRVYVALFGTTIVYVYDLADLAYWVHFMDGSSPSDPLYGPQFLNSLAFNQSYELYTGAIGDNYDVIGNVASAGTAVVVKTAHTNIASNPSPDPSTTYDVPYENSGSDFVEIASDQQTLFHTSAGRRIMRYDTDADAPLADFIVAPYEAKLRPGFRSTRLLPDGGLLVCDGDHVKRYDSSGTLMRSYYPSATARAQDLDKVEITADRQSFFVSDQLSTSLFKFDLATGTQLGDWELNLPVGQLCGFSIYGGYRAGITTDVVIVVPVGALVLEGYPVLVTTLVQPPAEGQGSRIVPTRRVRRAPHLAAEGRWAFYERFQLDLEAGVGLVDGQGADPQLMLRWSDDGGHTWSHEHWVSAGQIGAYLHRAVWRRLGRSRDRVFEVVISDPVKVAWIDAWVDVAEGVH